ncbi:hypothetical protein AVEN_249731-1 [Araneus ventricosus]|uniref:Uncharacterized protein n=1 Tax=Araneus ventricosus TaxID=182803 RepID=A0A4Y2C8N4_ARAVE|nr:hypothetical protein AVEN_249731-1 [Araneus ventricosus]
MLRRCNCSARALLVNVFIRVPLPFPAERESRNTVYSAYHTDKNTVNATTNSTVSPSLIPISTELGLPALGFRKLQKDGCGQFRNFIRKDSTINKEDEHKYEALYMSWGTTTSWEPPSLSMMLYVMTKAVNYSSDWFRYKVGSTLSREIDRVFSSTPTSYQTADYTQFSSFELNVRLSSGLGWQIFARVIWL